MGYILLLEDQALISALISKNLESVVDDEIVVCRSIETAFDRVSKSLPKAAFLDVNLGDETSFDIATWLLERSIAVYFLTSYSRQSLQALGMPQELENVQIVSKSSAAPTLTEIARAWDSSQLTNPDITPSPPAKRQSRRQGKL